MILVADVGNTNMTFGVYDGKELKCSFRMMAKTPRTSDLHRSIRSREGLGEVTGLPMPIC